MKLPILNRRSRKGSYRATELAVAALIAALVAGAIIGTGLAPTTLSTSDGLTWLADDERGEAVQINPATGQQETRLKVAQPDHTLALSQRDGLLVVTDATSGAVTVIDVATLATGGRWFGSGDGAIEVLLNAKYLFVVDRIRGAIQRLDPVNARPMGPQWTAGGLIVDAAMDGKGIVWALRTDGRLYSLTWSDGYGGLVESGPPHQVARAGPRSLLVPHASGVTVFAPEGGVAARVGTGDDTVLEVGQVPGTVHPAAESPVDLVPVSVAESATVILFHRGRSITVDVARLGCREPREPVVYRDRVYVACRDSAKIVVLNRDGQHLPPDIDLPAGEPRLVIDDGKLFIHIPGMNTGLVVSPDGTVSTTETHDETQPVNDPDNRPPVTAPTTKPPRNEGTQGPNVTPTSPSPSPATRTPGAPTGVTVAVLYEYGTTLRVEASWLTPADNGFPITGFTLALTSNRGFSRSLDLTALRSGAIEISCNIRCHGMQVQADVRATNSQGQGPAGRANYTHNAPAQAPVTNTAVITSVEVSEGMAANFHVYATFDPPFAWRTYEGTCTFHYTGPATGSRSILCWAADISTNFTGSPGQYRFWVQAGTVKSAEVNAYAYREPRDPPPCEGCNIP